ncbi:U3 small nucleolar RNA-associated protein 14 homolog A isoform X2 [Pseudorasbora parva]|uniref:U3 small nucleolar RNA-associated protein 14 homolog A isoform X2 n=1 Tax=Pseudorasbora parva TaxID=51549 RepID=UPI00351E2F82
MAKSSSLQKTALSKAVGVTSAMAEEGEELPIDEQAISASEDEEGSDDERKHNKLLEAISSMGGRKRKKQNERSEASVQVSEFFVNAEGTGDKVNLSDLLGTAEKTPGTSNKTKKQLRNLQNSKETLELPLNKQETEKIQRGIAYEKTASEVSCWKNIILQNRKAEQMVFPLHQEPLGPKRVEQVVAGWKIQTPLEQEIFRLLHNNSQPVVDPILTPVEEASLKAMSLEEAKVRRAELQKARALQSYYEAKANREKKIKSKKYRKFKKKGRVKDFLKQFEEMAKTDPQSALEELKKIELSRMEERMSLKHQNRGKWAKSKAIMAKYDDSARKAMQEQLQMNKDLTQKIVVLSDDEHDSKDEELNTVPDFVNDPEPIIDPVNPWMKGQLTREEPEVICVTPEDAETAAEENEEEVLIGEFERKRKRRQAEEKGSTPIEEKEHTREVVGEDVVEISDNEENDDKKEEEGEKDDDEEEEDVSQFNSLFKLMRSEKTQEGQEDGEGLLDEGPIRVRNIEDLEVLGEVLEPHPNVAQSLPQTASVEATTAPTNKKNREIKLNEVLTKEAKVINVPFSPTVVEEEHDEQISIIKEAFAGDDVISDFIKDKRKQEAAGRPKVVDLTLPGWGEWGGVGLKPSRWKRKRFRVRMAPPPPRQDQKLPDVIISEKRNASLAPHQVSQLPFPYQNPAQFESCIRTPIGQTWNTQSVVKKMTTPKVVTTMGAIIEPMVKEDFIKNKTTTPAAKAPAIMFGGDKGARRSTKRPSEKNQGRSQKRKK